MWFGSGGWLAAAVGTWTVVWALRWAGDRRWRAWGGTAIAALATCWCLALASIHSRLVVSIAKVAVTARPDKAAVGAEVFAGAFGPLWMALAFTAATLGALWWSRQAVTESVEGGGWWWVAVLTAALPALVSLGLLVIVDQVFLTSPGSIDFPAARAAFRLLRPGLLVAWLGIFGGFVWFAYRAVVRFRNR